MWFPPHFFYHSPPSNPLFLCQKMKSIESTEPSESSPLIQFWFFLSCASHLPSLTLSFWYLQWKLWVNRFPGFHLVLMVCFQVFSPSLSLIPFLMLSLQVLHVFFTVASFFLLPNSIALESTLGWIKLSGYNIPNKKYCSLQKKKCMKDI